MVRLRRSEATSEVVRSKYEPWSSGLGGPLGVGVREVEELHLGGDVEAQAACLGRVEVALEDLARVAGERAAVEVRHVAEDPGGGVVTVGPGEQVERRRIRSHQHVALLGPAEPVDRRTVELHALGEGALELGSGDRERLELAEHVGEPQADQPDATLLDGAQHVVLLTFHRAMMDTHLTDWKGRPAQFTRRSQC